MLSKHHWLFVLVPLVGLLYGCEKAAPPPAEPPADAPRASATPPPAATPNAAAKEHATASAKPAGPKNPHAGMDMPPAGAKNPHAGMDMPPAGAKNPHAGMKMPPAGAKNPHAGMDNPHEGVVFDPHATNPAGEELPGPQPTETKLDGIILQVPEGWVYERPPVNPRMPSMSPKAVFRLPRVEEDSQDVYVRITHFPSMKNISDEMNLERWFRMLQQPDGRPTQEVAHVEHFDAHGVPVVFADIPGTMKVSGAAKPDWRMLAAIIKDPQGPHFVKVMGPNKSVEHWKASVVQYLQSTTPTESEVPTGE